MWPSHKSLLPTAFTKPIKFHMNPSISNAWNVKLVHHHRKKWNYPISWEYFVLFFNSLANCDMHLTWNRINKKRKRVRNVEWWKDEPGRKSELFNFSSFPHSLVLPSFFVGWQVLWRWRRKREEEGLFKFLNFCPSFTLLVVFVSRLEFGLVCILFLDEWMQTLKHYAVKLCCGLCTWICQRH